ncbi:hypothetical protein DB347_19340 [Opitutaceae bacterium EW11]|nr:hypothetical protein DB347_19340 [Opitutaceae bacterium EW11]
MKTTKVVRFLSIALLAFGISTHAEEPGTRDRALSAVAAKNWEVAEPLLEQLAQANPADPDVCLQLGIRRLDEHRAKEAVDLIGRAAEAAPKRSDIQAQLGHALARRIGEVTFVHQPLLAARMRKAYLTAVELDSNNVGAWIGLTQYSLNAPEIAGGSMEKAEEYAKEVEKRAPGLGAIQRGQVCEQAGKAEEAAGFFRRATEIQPGDPWAWTCLGRVYANSGKLAEARQAFTTAIERQPGFPPAEQGLKDLAAKSAENPAGGK